MQMLGRKDDNSSSDATQQSKSSGTSSSAQIDNEPSETDDLPF